MKKILLVLIFLLIVLNVTYVYAYEDNSLKIDIPSEYKMIGNPPSFIKNSESPSITLIAEYNTVKKVNIEDLSDIEIKEFVPENTNNEFESNSKLLSYKKSKISEYNCITAVYKLEDLETYYEINMIYSDNYIYNIAFFSKNVNDFQGEEYSNIKNSLIIKDNISDYSNNSNTNRFDIKEILNSALTGAIICGIIGVLFTVINAMAKSEYEESNNKVLQYGRNTFKTGRNFIIIGVLMIAIFWIAPKDLTVVDIIGINLLFLIGPLFGILMIIQYRNWKIICNDDEKFIFINSFRKGSNIRYEDIVNYKLTNQYLIINANKKIKIDVRQVLGTESLINILKEKFIVEIQ